MNTDFYVLSLRSIKNTPAQCCVTEFEDVIIGSLNAKLIHPGAEIKTPGVLFIAALSIYDIDRALRTIKTPKFTKIYAYVFDAFVNINELKKSQWRKELSTHYRTIRKIDHLFVPFKHAVSEFEMLYNISVSYIPIGVDAVKHGGYDDKKIIDVNGYGRQNSSLVKMLSERFNCKGSDRVFYHTDHQHTPIIHNVYAHRLLFWNQLRKSRIALAFDPMQTNSERFRVSFVGQRWFESAAAGCVIVGKRPTCPEIGELFNWDDATIELPDDVQEMAEMIESLLESGTLDEIGKRNYEECLSCHDWRIRVREMLDVI